MLKTWINKQQFGLLLLYRGTYYFRYSRTFRVQVVQIAVDKIVYKYIPTYIIRNIIFMYIYSTYLNSHKYRFNSLFRSTRNVPIHNYALRRVYKSTTDKYIL